MPRRIVCILALLAAPAFCADWNPRLAAGYLDSRAKAWLAWPVAQHNGGVCISCHTNLSYLLARPALGRTLGENEASPYQAKLFEALRNRVAKATPAEFSPGGKEPSSSMALGVESVLAALVFASGDARHGSTLSQETEQAFDRMWRLQVAAGKNLGAWIWNSYDLEPWEEPASAFYGAALAALATGIAPGDYQSRPDIQEHVKALKTYLATQQSSQPLHNRLLLVWASTKLRDTLAQPERKAILAEALHRQQPDGGWTLESLGPWAKHTAAPPENGSNSYATAMTALALEQAGVSGDNPALARALDWLRSHQDPQTGAWPAQSMNKKYPADSMQLHFMQDAATGYASLALIESGSVSGTR